MASSHLYDLPGAAVIVALVVIDRVPVIAELGAETHESVAAGGRLTAIEAGISVDTIVVVVASFNIGLNVTVATSRRDACREAGGRVSVGLSIITLFLRILCAISADLGLEAISAAAVAALTVAVVADLLRIECAVATPSKVA